MKKILLSFLMGCACVSHAFDMQSMMHDMGYHPQKTLMLVAATLIARPLSKLVAQYVSGDEQKPFSAGSLVGSKLGVKDASGEKSERIRAQVSIGSFDVKVKVPTKLGLDGFLQKRRSAVKRGVPAYVADALADILSSFSPYLHVGIATKDTPIVRDKAAGVTPKTKRLFAEAACGTFCMRTGMDLEDVLIAPLALLTAYLGSYFSDMTAK